MAKSIGAVIAGLRDRRHAPLYGDALAAAVAAALPWSTTVSLVLISLWYLMRFAMGDYAAVRAESATPAGGLPLALCALGALGVLWAGGPAGVPAHVPWAERLDGLSGFYKLLAVPLLLAQFRQSRRGSWVLIGFAGSCAVLLAASWTLTLFPDLPWHGHEQENMTGIPARDYIAQGQAFTLCAFGFCEAALLAWRKARRWLAAMLLLLALAFLADMLYVAPSRTALLTIPVLLVLFLLQFGWRIAVPLLIVTAIAAGAAWQTSPILRQRASLIFEQIRDYDPSGERTSAGERMEYWRKSIAFVADAPVFGHGTGSIREQFRHAAVGERGAVAAVTGNPHNQIFAVAIQLGFVGTVLLLAMWTAHAMLFRGTGRWATLGIIVVAQNIVASLVNSHLFDFTQGWIYVWGVGVLGGLALRDARAATTAPTSPADRPV